MTKNLNLGNFLMISRPSISKLQFFSEKQVSFKLKVIFSANFRPKTKKNFRKYLQINHFFKKSGSLTFLALWVPNFMQKIRKILRAVSEKTALPTNQPTNYYQQHQFHRTSLTLVQQTRIEIMKEIRIK